MENLKKTGNSIIFPLVKKHQRTANRLTGMGKKLDRRIEEQGAENMDRFWGKSREKVRLRVILTLIAFVSFGGLNHVIAQNFTITLGGTTWSDTIDALDCPVAGGDVTSTYTSTLNAFTIRVKHNVAGSQNFQVTIKRTDTLWDARFRLDVSVTNSPPLPNKITAITEPLTITTVAQNFYSGTINGNSNSGILRLQFTLYNMSVVVGPHVFSTTITYTVTP
jgi:hypothetical protein